MTKYNCVNESHQCNIEQKKPIRKKNYMIPFIKVKNSH